MLDKYRKLVQRIPRRTRVILGYMANIPLFGAVFPCLIVRGGRRLDRRVGIERILPPPWQVIIAGPLFVMGGVFQLWSWFHLVHRGKGHPFSNPNIELAPHPEELVSGGPYRLCRNPMLFGGHLYYLATAMLSNSPGAVFFMWPAFLLASELVVRYLEEPGLEEMFGSEYREYKERTPRFIPRLKLAA